MFLIQAEFSCRKDMKIFISEFTFLVLRKYSNILWILEHTSQLKKIFLNKFCGFCSVLIADIVFAINWLII